MHIPYSSAGQALTAALSSQVPIVFSSIPPTLVHIATGKLRALAVTGSTRHSESVNTPTMGEAGHGSVDGESWFGFVVPAATPRDIVTILYRALAEAMENPAVRVRLPGLGFEPVMSTHEASAVRLRSEGEKWARIIRTAGMKAE